MLMVITMAPVSLGGSRLGHRSRGLSKQPSVIRQCAALLLLAATSLIATRTGVSLIFSTPIAPSIVTASPAALDHDAAFVAAVAWIWVATVCWIGSVATVGLIRHVSARVRRINAALQQRRCGNQQRHRQCQSITPFEHNHSPPIANRQPLLGTARKDVLMHGIVPELCVA